MNVTALTGSRIRERRAQTGLRQAELARAAGVSASYLNLIEHNRRRVAGEVLERIAGALGVSRALLEGETESETLTLLREAAALQGESGPPPERAEDFLHRFPGWAALVASQARRLEQLERSLEVLGDRMTEDPHLSANLHELLSAATAVRATAAILAETPDLEADWRARFEANLASDSARLAEGAEALAGYLDGVGTAETGLLSPQEALEAWLTERGWHLPGLEAGLSPEAILQQEGGPSGAAARQLALDWLRLCAADARVLPLERFLPALPRAEHDPGRLAAAFGVSPAAVFRRYAMMPDTRLAVGVVITDAAGAPLLRRGLSGFTLPRFGAACALWPLFTALARPGQPVRARIEMAGRDAAQFETRAWCELRWPEGFDGAPVLRSHMLVLPAAAEAPALPVGSSCRICPRAACPARREPALVG